MIEALIADTANLARALARIFEIVIEEYAATVVRCCRRCAYCRCM